jgi:hypothetical protein
MFNEDMINKLASKLDKEELAALGHLLQKVAQDSALAGAQARESQDDQISKLATDLVAQGFSDDEIVLAVDKLAEERQVTEECGNIVDDCATMGSYIGKFAGDVALQVFFEGLQDYVKKAGDDKMPPELFASKEDKQEDKDDEDKEKEEESEEEKEASARIAVLTEILSGSAFKSK